MERQTLTPKEREAMWKQIQALCKEVIELNGGHDIEFTTAERKEAKWYKGWQSTMKSSF